MTGTEADSKRGRSLIKGALLDGFVLGASCPKISEAKRANPARKAVLTRDMVRV